MLTELVTAKEVAAILIQLEYMALFQNVNDGCLLTVVQSTKSNVHVYNLILILS